MEKNKNNKSAMGVSSLVLGIISIVASLFWYITLPAGILAIIFGAKSIKKTGRKIGKAGLTTGIIGLSIGAFCYIGMVIIIVLANVI